MKFNLILAILLLCSVVSYADFLKILKKRSIDDNSFENSDKISINENGIIDSMDKIGAQRISEQCGGGTTGNSGGYYGGYGSYGSLPID
jgi:hypothetical protein